MMNLGEFTNLYSLLPKTLRFELKPIGKTLEYLNAQIKESDTGQLKLFNTNEEPKWDFDTHTILENDKHRAESYKKVKKIIDEYHKKFIEKSLKDFVFNKPNEKDKIENEVDLNTFRELLLKKEKTDKQKDELTTLQLNLRKQIVNRFDTNKRLFKGEFIKEDLPNFDYVKQNVQRINLVREFEDFTTYFAGFHENRKICIPQKKKQLQSHFG
jgi:CRISPR-associated protein Cpf1